MSNRRYDIDWIRVIAIGLLLIYHTAIGFQPWGGFIGFITHNNSWESIWVPMTMLNVWRIPILFYVSGMGVYLATQNRNWIQLFKERFVRIGVPLLFGSLVIVPIHWLVLQHYYGREFSYMPGLGHLWFLGNILLYVLALAPVYYFLIKSTNNKAVVFIKRILSTPFGLLLFLSLFLLEVLFVKPVMFEMYAFTFHGLVLGMLAFLSGFLFMLGGESFWKTLLKWKWICLLIALVLFIVRSMHSPIPASPYLLSIESNTWIFSILGFAYTYLNNDSRWLVYFKEAAYPVYIVHMAFLYIGSWLLFPLNLDVKVKFILLLFFTLLASVFFYEFILKRSDVLRPLFGLKRK